MWKTIKLICWLKPSISEMEPLEETRRIWELWREALKYRDNAFHPASLSLLHTHTDIKSHPLKRNIALLPDNTGYLKPFVTVQQLYLLVSYLLLDTDEQMLSFFKHIEVFLYMQIKHNWFLKMSTQRKYETWCSGNNCAGLLLYPIKSTPTL